MVLEKQKYVKEYLKVLQESLDKDDLADIISGIAVGEDVTKLLEKAMLNVKSPSEQEVHDAVQPFNPKLADPRELVDSLRQHVVRLVFFKVDGTRRIMYATRNPQVIELYDANAKNPNKPLKDETADLDSQEKIEQQIERDAIRVFDLEKNEFRAFKPSRLAAYDNADEVGSWVEFKPEYDSWYIMAKEDGDIHKYYVGDRMVKNIGKSVERRQYEKQAKQDLQDAIYTREQNAKREEQLENDPEHQAKMQKMKLESAINVLINKHMMKFKGTEFSAEFENIYLFGIDKLKSIQERYPNKLQIIKEYPEVSMVVFKLNDNVLLFHPHLLFDTTVKYVFADYTGMFKSTTKNIEGLEEELFFMKDITAYMQEKAPKVRKPLNPRYTEKDKERAIKSLSIQEQFPLREKYEVDFSQAGITTVIKSLKEPITVTVTPYVSTLTYTDGRVRKVELSRRKTPTAVLPHVDDTIEALGNIFNSNKNNEYAKIIKALEVVQTAYNLRTVKFDNARINNV